MNAFACEVVRAGEKKRRVSSPKPPLLPTSIRLEVHRVRKASTYNMSTLIPRFGENVQLLIMSFKTTEL